MKIYLITGILISVLVFTMYILIKINGDIRKKAYQLFLKAEELFITGSGSFKMDYVIENIYPYLPNYLKMFISLEMFKKIIQRMFNEIKDFLKTGKTSSKLGGYSYE